MNLIPPQLAEGLAARLGGRPALLRSVTGGDINHALHWQMPGGASYFVKWNDALDPEAFRQEAEGLRILRETNVIRVPQSMHAGAVGRYAYLVLEWIDSARPGPSGWAHLGENLARLHQHTGDVYGLASENLIGRLPQKNALTSDWSEFWATRRILPTARRAREASLLSPALLQRIEHLCGASARLCERPGLRPSLLHGDLWSGNVMFDAAGAPVLVDPAVYYGDREVEMAFTELFGGFDPSFYTAYQQSFPLEQGYEGRKAFWQLYPLLVHLNLFGRSYLAGVERCVAQTESRL